MGGFPEYLEDNDPDMLRIDLSSQPNDSTLNYYGSGDVFSMGLMQTRKDQKIKSCFSKS